MLHAKAVRIPFAHGLVKAIRVDEALAVPGVVAVLLPEDMRDTYGDETWVQVLVRDRVRSYADAVAVVAAETEPIATEASRRVRVEYEELPAVFDVEESIKPGAPQLYGKSNIFQTHRIRRGNVNQGFDEADVVLERAYSMPFAEHAYLEPETGTGLVEPDGRIAVYGSIKSPFDVRRMVAKVMNLALDRVRVVPATLGGYFGGKDEDMALMACRVALLARKTGRPVRISNTREESVLESTKRHRYVMKYRVGAKRNGLLTAMEADILADAGAYSVKTPLVTFRSCMETTGPYVIPHVKVDVRCVFTNNNDTGSFRGFGSPQVNFATESIVDELAEELDMDPFLFRRLNAFREGSVTATGQVLEGPVTVTECMDQAVSRTNWKGRTAFPSEGPVKRGLGMAASFRGISLGGKAVDTAGSIVSIQEDGRVVVSCGILEGGQGPRTVLCQICAEALGVSFDQVSFLDWDTSSVPDSGPTVASRGTFVGGNATQQACESLRGEILSVISEVLGVSGDELVSSEGIIQWEKDPGIRMTFAQAVAEGRRRGRNLTAVGWYKAPATGVDHETGQGNPFFKYVFGADVAEVEVDTLTGSVRLLNFVSVHDVGKTIHPGLAAGQIYGGVSMGLGTTLYEEYRLENHRPVVLNLDRYLIPTAMDMGSVTAILHEGRLAEGPYGASSIGEPASQNVAPAIMNAIANATGRRVYDLPAGLEKVFLGSPAKKGSTTKDEKKKNGNTLAL
jgi:CO/xanthine dehydrogenase Mo-binding subunit